MSESKSGNMCYNKVTATGSRMLVLFWLCSQMADVMIEFDAEVCVDIRERALIQEFERNGAKGYKIEALPAGDVSCTYCKDGHGWLVERKTTKDLVASICDGRYTEQRGRLFETAYQIMFIIEGDLRPLPNWHQTMLSSIVSLNAGAKSRVYRTWDVKETFDLIGVLVKKLENTREQSIPYGLSLPKVLSKRKRNASPSICFIRMLCCIPSVSEK